MILELFTNPILFLVWLFALLVAVDVHEFAHAWMADRLGDPTPRVNDRLTLNPLAHLDPVGTIMLLLTRFGWGKPVPIDSYNLENPRRDSALIALAGPASNLILAAILSLISHLAAGIAFGDTRQSLIISYFMAPLIILNVSLAIFNLLPIPPLDGSNILLGVLSPELADRYEETIGQYGVLIIFFLIFPFAGQSLASQLISPIINYLLDLLL